MDRGRPVTRPNFLFIGPDKTGSSWMFHILSRHPDCFVPVAKDIYFFDRYYSKGMGWYLRHFDASEREMTKYIIGTMSGIDMPLTPQMKGNVAAVGWIRGISQADRLKLRDEVLATRQQDIRALADLVADGMAQDTFCVFGNEVKLQENQSIFKRLKNVMG